MKTIDYYEISKRKLKYLNYSQRTIDIYTHYIDKFVKESKVPPSRLNANHFSKYLQGFNFTSISQQNQVISALKFFYKKVLNKKYGKVEFDRPRKEKKLPVIIDHKTLVQKIERIPNIKHKAILSIAYSVGLRVSEIINLKISDIDSERMLLYIKEGKGKKHRVLPLSENVLKILRIYYKEYKPEVFMFNGQGKQKYSQSSCQAICKKYISPTTTIHKLRHSCFTHLLESGTDIRIIQKLAGHQNIKTTEIYTHVANNILSKIKTPI